MKAIFKYGLLILGLCLLMLSACSDDEPVSPADNENNTGDISAPMHVSNAEFKEKVEGQMWSYLTINDEGIFDIKFINDNGEHEIPDLIGGDLCRCRAFLAEGDTFQYFMGYGLGWSEEMGPQYQIRSTKYSYDENTGFITAEGNISNGAYINNTLYIEYVDDYILVARTCYGVLMKGHNDEGIYDYDNMKIEADPNSYMRVVYRKVPSYEVNAWLKKYK